MEDSGICSWEASRTAVDAVSPRLEDRAEQEVGGVLRGIWLEPQVAAGNVSWEPWGEVRADDLHLEVSEYGALQPIRCPGSGLETEKASWGDGPLGRRREQQKDCAGWLEKRGGTGGLEIQRAEL